MRAFIVFSLLLGASLAEVRINCVGKVNPECTAEGDVDLPEIIQGDMVKPSNETEEEFGRNALLRGTWPNGQIPYVFHQAFSAQEKQIVQQAMNIIMGQTCVRFVPWNGRGPVTIITNQNQGCYSVVGYGLDRNGYAYLNLQRPGCTFRGIAVHELLHLSGLYHEQSRPDRDNFVTILWNNIQKTPQDMSHNFDRRSPSHVTTFGLPYDYQSLMHYGNYDFSINPNQPTIIHKTNPNVRLGQRDGPTYYDLEKVRRMYKC